MRTEYWASQVHICMVAMFGLLVGNLCMYPYVFLEGPLNIGNYVLSFLMGGLFVILCGIVYERIKYPHVTLCDDQLISPPWVIFPRKTVSLDRPFQVNEIGWNIGIQQDGKNVHIIRSVLRDSQFHELKKFLIGHKFNM
ncbi:hypothetical protein A9Q99_19155 [Gammaproteobacteria bacterium 45_16_T64]|nr:hypothetical protein A9Q99_19155 [Gammaproteobacteria bacterium 45_16_T64]